MPDLPASDAEAVDNEDAENKGSEEESAGGNAGGWTGGIDLERLADRVYRLMQAEVRLEQNRGARVAGRSGHDT